MQTGDRAGLHEAMGKLKGGLTVAPDAAAAWAGARGGRGTWVTVGVDAGGAGAGAGVAALRGSGTGGWAECAPSLGDGDVLFGACAFTLGGIPRHFFFSWAGAGVPPLRRGKVPLQKGGVAAAFEGCAADLTLSADRDELAPAAVVARLTRALASGSAVEL